MATENNTNAYILIRAFVGEDNKGNYRVIKDAFDEEFAGSVGIITDIWDSTSNQERTNLKIKVCEDTTNNCVSLHMKGGAILPAIISGNRADLLDGDTGDYLGIPLETLHDVYKRAIGCTETKAPEISATEIAMIKLGGNLWVKNGMRRVYFDSSIIARMGGLEITRYSSGFVCGAKLNGETISHRSGGSIAAQIDDIKCWHDCVEDKIYTKNISTLYGPAKQIVDEFIEFLVAAKTTAAK